MTQSVGVRGTRSQPTLEPIPLHTLQLVHGFLQMMLYCVGNLKSKASPLQACQAAGNINAAIARWKATRVTGKERAKHLT